MISCLIFRHATHCWSMFAHIEGECMASSKSLFGTECDPHFISRRSNQANLAPNEHLQRRFFQLSDAIYSRLYPYLSLPNKKVMLHCVESGGLGDISHTFIAADIIHKNRPDCALEIMVQPQTKTTTDLEITIAKIFSDKPIPVKVLSINHSKSQEIIKDLLLTHYFLGIAVGISSPELYRRHYRCFREHGFGLHCDTKENVLSMGLAPDEEGIPMPPVVPRPLSALTSDWLRNTLAIDSAETQANYLGTRKLYHQYFNHWAMQILALISIACIEKNNLQSIDIVMPLEYSLQELRDWGIWDLIAPFLAANGIGKIIRTTPAGSEFIYLTDKGKDVRILSGPGSIPKKDNEAIQQHSSPLFGSMGDVSFIEGVVLDKIIFYQISIHKIRFFKSLQEIAKEQTLDKVSNFLNLLAKFDENEDKIYKKNTPQRRGGWWEGAPSHDMRDKDSVPRRSIPQLVPQLLLMAQELAQCYLDPKLLSEMVEFNRYIKAHHDVTVRLLQNVDRGIILNNYPKLIDVENSLWESYKTGSMTFEDVCKNLEVAIRSIAQVEVEVEVKAEPKPLSLR